MNSLAYLFTVETKFFEVWGKQEWYGMESIYRRWL